ncbi:galactose oxidase-like domain-containing protein [Nocardia sp. NPDC056611]|uniref:galactose oxidase-like domain-containing protein n=1 Tax=Nocardia sp. NPDC056611 TaxID=3345877 RepID=UPI00366C03A5
MRPIHRGSVVRWVLAVALLVTVVASAPSAQAENLMLNAGMETLGADGFPDCWEKSGWGDNDSTFAVTDQAHSGSKAVSITITRIASGDRKTLVLENAQCAPQVTVGHQYDLSVWYKTTTPNTVVTMFRHDVTAGWQYWTDLSALPVTAAYANAGVRTPAVPANTDRITWGVTIYGVGTLVTDDYGMSDATPATPPPACTAGAACTKGSWEVLAFEATVRGIHAAVLPGGKVLLIAGSGNDPTAFAAGTFKTAVYDPATGQFADVTTPFDAFCAGHVMLPDGRLLVMGGNKDYPAADGSHGYEGLKDAYVFDPADNSYHRLNDMNAGHWYPSATVMGNGDVLSLGGLGEDSSGTVSTEYFSYAQQRWLGMGEIPQTWRFWGLYPSMVLLQDGRLFYTGSHVFGNGLSGTGASIYDYAAGTVTDIPGLRDKDERDQSMSVLLPPAQDQRVATFGGGNIVTNVDANALTDIVDLKAATPSYQAGPGLPTPKMYVSAVLLPDGKVFETGGGLHNRADPVYEASMFDPAANSFTPGMATDPVPRTYHSSAFLLPDGRVMAVGDNPGNGTFDKRISIYSPPYLFQGARPEITAVANTNWAYGSSQQITVNGQIAKASLIRPAAVTHSSDPNQRYLDLPLTVDATGTKVNLTTNPNLAPPGWYMLFVANAAGVPSVAQWVHVG